MAECLENIVSIRGSCSPETSGSGFYLDDFDISLEEIGKYVGSEFANAEALVQAKKRVAAHQVAAKIGAYFKGQFLHKSILSGERIGFEQTDQELIAADATKWGGTSVEFKNLDSFLQVNISEISLYSNYTGNVSLRVYDIVQGKLLDTITLATVAGEISRTYVNKTYSSDRRNLILALVYLRNGIGSYKTLLTGSHCGQCTDTNGNKTLNNFAIGRAVSLDDGDSFIYDNFDSADDTAGLSFVYSISCNHYNWLCSIQKVLGLPMLYKTAAELMHYGLQQVNRFNTNAGLNPDVLKMKADRYEALFEESMTDLLPSMILPSDTRCFLCNDYGRFYTILP
jgi:hypothetical protein